MKNRGRGFSEFPARPAGRGRVRQSARIFFLFMYSITRAQMPTLGRKTCFNTGVGDDGGADDVMLIFVLVNPVVDRYYFFFIKPQTR